MVEQVSCDGFHIQLEHCSPYYDHIDDLQHLSKEFSYILLSKDCLGPNDRWVLMAKNIVFEPIKPKFFAIQSECALIEHTIQVEDNV